ncbi:MAG: endo-1,4-beta-xylanase, partial [Clostridiales bacterium]|nr:endo-1,4-beta-xylanase [Clostridiales bacterium]
MNERFSHRMGESAMRFVRRDGSPLANSAVRVKQVRHQFLFGCGGFDAVELSRAPDGSPTRPERLAFLEDRLSKVFALNNYATLPFYWGRYEPEEGRTDENRLRRAARWFKDRGVKVKGHPLCWHTVCADWLMNYDNQTVLKKIRARIDREVSGFVGDIDIWDVINEVVIMPVFDKYDNAVTRVCKTLGRVGMIKEVFAAARDANPSATLLLNDFNVSPEYEILIDGCLQAGVTIDAIGIQSHQHQGYWGREKTEEVLERFSRFGLPIHFTENTIISGDLMPSCIEDLNDWQVDAWPTTPDGEARQAR